MKIKVTLYDTYPSTKNFELSKWVKAVQNFIEKVSGNSKITEFLKCHLIPGQKSNGSDIPG